MKRHILAYLIAIVFVNVPILTARDIPPIIGIIQSDTAHSSFGQRSIVPAGDQNADGFSDFWTWDSRLQAYLFRGTRGAVSSIPALTLSQVSPNGANIGNYDEDSSPDYAWLDWISLSKLYVYLGGPLMDSIGDYSFGLDSSTIDTDLRPFGNAKLYDIDSNGTKELVVQSRDQASVLVYQTGSSGDSIQDLILHPNGSPHPASSFGRGIAVGNFVGGSSLDLVVSLNPPEICGCKGQVWLYSGGATYDTIPELRFTQPGPFSESRDRFGSLLVNLGDVNGDGYDDLFAGPGNSADSLSYIYFGGGSVLDTIPDITITEDAISAGAAGDLNRDGYQDLIIGFPLVSSVAAYVYVYYGGQDLDSLPDIQIYAQDLPVYTTRFGSVVVGIGDFNGDGVDDFAAGSDGASGYGKVFVFSGTGLPNDIPDTEEQLPKVFTLHPNYPNPFNPSTTITFDLPRGARVTLSIVNIRGQEVARLVDQEMSAGSHSVEWDGRDASGKPVASGVYLYRLETGDGVLSRKMLLLK